MISTSFSDFKGLSQLLKNLFFPSTTIPLVEAIDIMIQSKDAQSVSRQALPDTIKVKVMLF